MSRSVRLAQWARTPAMVSMFTIGNLGPVQHAFVPVGREIGVRVARYEGRLRVEVADANNNRPVPREAQADEETGRGLAFVTALAVRWGCCPRMYGIGKAVWAELLL